MTQPSLLDLLLAEPGLAVCGGLVLLFAFVAWRKLLEAADADRRRTEEWFAERKAYREHEQRVRAAWDKVADPSSLSDDSPEVK